METSKKHTFAQWLPSDFLGVLEQFTPSLSIAAALMLTCMACGSATVKVPHEQTTGTNEPCSAEAAWDAFETSLRESYAYLERDSFDVDAQLAHSKRLSTSASNKDDIRKLLLRTTYAFTDPHLLVGPLDDDDFNIIYTSSDLVVRREGTQYVVTDVRQGSSAALAGVRPGWKLVAFAGETIDDAIDRLLGGVVLTPNPAQLSYAATMVANGVRSGVRKLTFAVDGRNQNLSLENPRKLAKEVSKRDPVKVIPDVDGIVVIRVENALGREATIEAFDSAVAEVLDAKLLIIDLRNTPSGGNTDIARSIIGHFITESKTYQRHKIPAVERSTTVPREFVEYVTPRAPYFPNRVAVLGSRWTGSMGEGLVIGLQAAAGAKTFTSDMGDLLGAVHSRSLGQCDAFMEFAMESLFHVDGTPREFFVADKPLESSDMAADGSDPGLTAVRRWAASNAP